ncbi:MAG: DnaJ domain-containing protein [Gammaproteobacteria bacterium]
MTNPFQVLGVPDTADDVEIKKAYLKQVRQYPPERAPERFQTIRRAFESIQTRRDRLRYQLFQAEPPSPAELLEALVPEQGSGRPSLELLQRALAQSLQILGEERAPPKAAIGGRGRFIRKI